MRLLIPIVIILAFVTFAVTYAERIARRASNQAAPSAAAEVAGRPVASAAQEETETGVFYRWRDADGRVNIQSIPPSPDVDVELIRFERVLPKGITLAGKGGVAKVTYPVNPTPMEFIRSPFSVYSPEGLEVFLDLVDTTVKRLDQRRETFEALKKQL